MRFKFKFFKKRSRENFLKKLLFSSKHYKNFLLNKKRKKYNTMTLRQDSVIFSYSSKIFEFQNTHYFRKNLTYLNLINFFNKKNYKYKKIFYILNQNTAFYTKSFTTYICLEFFNTFFKKLSNFIQYNNEIQLIYNLFFFYFNNLNYYLKTFLFYKMNLTVENFKTQKFKNHFSVLRIKLIKRTHFYLTQSNSTTSHKQKNSAIYLFNLYRKLNKYKKINFAFFKIKPLTNIFFNSMFLYNSQNVFKNKFKKLPDFFILSRYDKISIDYLRLTNFTKKIDPSFILITNPAINQKSLRFNKTPFNLIIKDDFFQSNFFFWVEIIKHTDATRLAYYRFFLTTGIYLKIPVKQ